MLSSAHQGYIYQDILGAYFIAHEIAEGRLSTSFHFDQKKTPKGVPDKFDDLTIYQEKHTTLLQIKYSNRENQHALTKQDFSSKANYDLALHDLFETWLALQSPNKSFRVCLAWDQPDSNDSILDVLIRLPDKNSFLPNTICYKFECDKLWPKGSTVLSTWRALKKRSKSINRNEFKTFLNSLIVEVNYPKSSLLDDYAQGLEQLLKYEIKKIGVGIYPNDHLKVQQVAESLCTIAKRERALEKRSPLDISEIVRTIHLIQDFGGIEQNFPVDEDVLIETPQRVNQIVQALDNQSAVVLTAEPGAGKSWFIENLEKHVKETTQVIKHYCYTALHDPLSLKRITVNVLYGSLIAQIIATDPELGGYKAKRYASNLGELNLLLNKIEKKTLIIVDGIDHIWRVYQNNRGGITEDETKILEALSQLDVSNPNVSLLVVSQPVEQLKELYSFYNCKLAPLREEFIEELLEKYAIKNYKVHDKYLSQIIYQKSEGNALYIKYLIDHAITNKAQSSFEWISSLPPYEFNLTGYYQYLYDQIDNDKRVPCALCGADFSLTESEIQEITHVGTIVSEQLILIKPILKYSAAHGYSIYHESFKRFLIDKLKESGASIEHLIYNPIIEWLELKPFFESTKAYGHLLKLYFEVDALAKIANTISLSFIEDSLHYAQPFYRISQNHDLQRASLKNADGFNSMIIIAEQSKIISELDYATDEALVNYLNAIKLLYGQDEMYRVLWDGEHLLVNTKTALQFLVDQVYQGEDVVHWDVVPALSEWSYDIIGFIAVKLIHTRQYQKLDRLIRNVYENPEHKEAFENILDAIKWYGIRIGQNWIENTLFLKDFYTNYSPTSSTLTEAVNRIINGDRFVYDDQWREMARDVIELTKSATEDEIDDVLKKLSNYNWFRNWVIYLIKISELSTREYSDDELIETFSYLVRDLEPFKGEPRACDFYKQLPFIKQTFHQGLLLCKGNSELLVTCCELLEKVTELTTSMQRAYSGPLTQENFLELIEVYLPGDYVLSKYEKYYESLGTKRVYSDVAELAFKYARILKKQNSDKKAKEKYREGVQALTAYGYRKDRTLSDVLYPSVPFQKVYGSLDVDWFFELYYMSMTVVTHTDGKSTSRYPIEWFQEFIKVFPNEALRFLISETIVSKEANWHQESEFLHVIEDYPMMFSPTQWYLLCRSLPLARSEEIIKYGFDIMDHIDAHLKDSYRGWLLSLIENDKGDDSGGYSYEVAKLFKNYFGISLKVEEEKKEKEYNYGEKNEVKLKTDSIENVLAFLEENTASEDDVSMIKSSLNKMPEFEDRKKIYRQFSKSIGYRYRKRKGSWIEELVKQDESDWIYYNVCLFVYLLDGWLSRLNYMEFLKRAYQTNPKETLKVLKEVLGNGDAFTHSFSQNLIKALIELEAEEKQVYSLLRTVKQIIDRRLPHKPNSEIDRAVYNGLEGFTQDELVVALLIARLKTLTTEKTQGIIWALTFITESKPNTVFKPYLWAFSNSSFLLPIHRSILLQILIENVDRKSIPDSLIGKLLKNYPTGFFLEDQYIRSFVNYRIDLDESSANFIQHESHKYDRGFFPYIHFKYRTLKKHVGHLTGTYNAFQYKRAEISKDHDSYQIRTDKVITPIVSMANAVYEIINSQFYSSLKEITNYAGTQFNCNLEFFISEILLQVGAKERRPLVIPLPNKITSFEVKGTNANIEFDKWMVIASKEKEFYGEEYKEKKSRISSIILTNVQDPEPEDVLTGDYLFKVYEYLQNVIKDAPKDRPVSKLDIIDTLEYSRIVFLSPYVVRELNLRVDSNLHDGFKAYNDHGDVIAKMITWKEEYYGDVTNGTEVPRLEGTAVLLRKDYYEQLLSLYDRNCCFVFRQDSKDM